MGPSGELLVHQGHSIGAELTPLRRHQRDLVQNLAVVVLHPSDHVSLPVYGIGLGVEPHSQLARPTHPQVGDVPGTERFVVDANSACREPPRWQCQDCNRVFDGRSVDPKVANIDDVRDVF